MSKFRLKEREVEIKPTVKTIINLEERFKKGFMEIFQTLGDVDKLKLSDLIAIFEVIFKDKVAKDEIEVYIENGYASIMEDIIAYFNEFIGNEKKSEVN